MTELKTLMSGLGYGESPRWHDGRLWFADWGAQEIIAVDLDGAHEVDRTRPSLAARSTGCPTDAADPSRAASCCAGARRLAGHPRRPQPPLGHGWNEIVVDGAATST